MEVSEIRVPTPVQEESNSGQIIQINIPEISTNGTNTVCKQDVNSTETVISDDSTMHTQGESVENEKINDINNHDLGGTTAVSKNYSDVSVSDVLDESSNNPQSTQESKSTDEDVAMEVGKELDYFFKKFRKEFSTLNSLKNHSRSNCKNLTTKKLISGKRQKISSKTLIPCAGKFYCDICKKEFSRHSFLQKHMKNKHCFKTESSSFENNKHTRNSRFPCPMCDKVFYKFSALELHKRIHTNERPYSCDVCKKSFKQKAHIERHCLVHTDEIPYNCKICGKAYKDKHLLQKHLEAHVHTPEKLFICTDCDKRFSRKQCLEAHKHVHSDQKPFKCAHCTKMFTHSTAHLRHERKHEVVELVCETCKEKVISKRELMIHVGRHAKEVNVFRQNIFKNFKGILEMKKIKEEGGSCAVPIKEELKDMESDPAS